jgi:acyl-CoA synthetase (AMP-forming)/AMP-acid ligase II
LIDLVRRHPRERVALIDASRRERIGYGELLDRADEAGERLKAAAGARPLAFLAMAPDADAVVLYLACLAAQIPLVLAEPQPEPLARLARAYDPDLLLLPQSLAAPPGWEGQPSPAQGYRMWLNARAAKRPIHPDLALLLTTSGSTGSPKLVRLTTSNLASNAISIAHYLGLGPDERAIASLPMHYSYGLSVLHSHLVAGGSVVVTPHSFLRPEFWAVVDGERCTSFAGVPYMYETLHRLRFDPARRPSLRAFTQAGGALKPDLIAHFHGLAERAGARLFVMYGQTEATARISYVPPPDLPRKVGSIGIPIPGGRLSLSPVEGAAGLTELVYEGPNVMLGYAESPEDLARGDVLNGVLRTGDLGRVDDDGFHYVTGRLKRFAKLFGRRVSLEDIEREIEARFPVQAAATDGGDRIVVHAQALGPAEPAEIGVWLAGMLGVPPAAVLVRSVGSLPRTASGKKDYRALGLPA